MILDLTELNKLVHYEHFKMFYLENSVRPKKAISWPPHHLLLLQLVRVVNSHADLAIALATAECSSSTTTTTT